MYDFRIPANNYLRKPEDESCYSYLLGCYKRISKDIGKDYTAFVTPVGPVESETGMERFISDIEKLAAFLASKNIGKGDVFTAFLPTCGHAAVAFYAVTKIGAVVNFVHPLTPPPSLKKYLSTQKARDFSSLTFLQAPIPALLKNI